MLYVKLQVWLSRAGDNDHLLTLYCDCAVSFVSQAVVEGVNKKDKKTKLAKALTTKTWYLGRVYRWAAQLATCGLDNNQI